jgi:hypothetical protein
MADSDLLRGAPGHQRLLLSLVGPERLVRLLTVLLDEAEFLSPHGLRPCQPGTASIPTPST